MTPRSCSVRQGRKSQEASNRLDALEACELESGRLPGVDFGRPAPLSGAHDALLSSCGLSHDLGLVDHNDRIERQQGVNVSSTWFMTDEPVDDASHW